MHTTPHKKGFFGNLKYDIPASIIVFLVALPLCLGIALASGAPLFSGIIAGIIGGIVVGLISKSQLGVSGPAAGLIVIVISAIEELGSFEGFLAVVVIAGVIQILLGLLRAGVIGYYFPSSVIKGMLSGIGVLIILKQIPHAFGYDKDPEGDLAFFQVDGHTTLSDLWYMFDYVTPGATIIAIISLAILILWEQPFIKKIPIFKIIQGPLIVVLTGIALNIAFESNDYLRLENEHDVNIPVANNFSEFLGQFKTPDFSVLVNGGSLLIAITIAVVASLETLLCVEAADKLDPERRVTPTSRELVAQGAGNIVSGMIGGLPITQVIVRSSANVQSGGKSKASTVFHGFLLLISAVFIPKYLNYIPLASLAAILLLVGYKLAKPAVFITMYHKGREQFIPFVVTILAIVFTDLLKGIGTGMVVAIFYILWNNYKNPYHFRVEEQIKGEPLKITLAEDVTFLNKASILRTLNQIPDNTKVNIDASKAKHIDLDVLEIIENFQENAESRGIELYFKGFSVDVKHNPEQHFNEVLKSKV